MNSSTDDLFGILEHWSSNLEHSRVLKTAAASRLTQASGRNDVGWFGFTRFKNEGRRKAMPPTTTWTRNRTQLGVVQKRQNRSL